MKGALAILALAGTGVFALPEPLLGLDSAVELRDKKPRPDSTIASACCHCHDHEQGGKRSLFKRLMCPMCGINWINIPINRGCPTATAVPTPTSTPTTSATPTPTPQVYNFLGSSNWTLSTQVNSPWINAVYEPDDCGDNCTTAGLINVLAGTGQAPYNDSQGRVPVMYEAQLDQFNVSQLQIANFNVNDPHGMKVARLYEFYDGAEWTAFAGPDARAPFGNQTAYEQGHPSSNNTASLTLFACGQIAVGGNWDWPVNATLYVARSTEAYPANITTYLNSPGSHLFTVNGQPMEFCSSVGAVPPSS